MSAATRARAPSGAAWERLDWPQIKRHVRGLQARIVKATQESRHNKAKALQWLLTHSFSGRALAVKRVTENKGKNTPGVDQITWKTPVAKINAIASLKRRGYSPLPLRRVLIPKKNGKKMRPLGIPAMKCRAMQALHLLALEPIAETTADLNSYGFRPERSTTDAEEHVSTLAKAAVHSGCWRAIFKAVSTNQSRLDARQRPYGQGDAEEVAQGGFVYQDETPPTPAPARVISPALANDIGRP